MNVNATKYRHSCQCDVLNRPGQLKIEVDHLTCNYTMQDCEVWDLKKKKKDK